MDRRKLLEESRDKRKHELVQKVLDDVIHNGRSMEKYINMEILKHIQERDKVSYFAEIKQRNLEEKLRMLQVEISELQENHPTVYCLQYIDPLLRSIEAGSVNYNTSLHGEAKQVSILVGVDKLINIINYIEQSKWHIYAEMKQGAHPKISELMDKLEELESRYTQQLHDARDKINKNLDIYMRGTK